MSILGFAGGRQKAYFVQVRKKKGDKGRGANLYKKSADRRKKRRERERERRCKIGKGARERVVQVWMGRVITAGQPRGRS